MTEMMNLDTLDDKILKFRRRKIALFEHIAAVQTYTMFLWLSQTTDHDNKLFRIKQQIGMTTAHLKMLPGNYLYIKKSDLQKFPIPGKNPNENNTRR